MDTLKHYDRLRAAGVPDEQARAQVETMAGAATKEELAAVVANMATKEDLAAAVANMATKEDLSVAVANMATKEDLSALEGRMERRLEERMDSKLAVFRSEIRGDFYKAMAALAVGIVFLIARSFFGG